MEQRLRTSKRPCQPFGTGQISPHAALSPPYWVSTQPRRLRLPEGKSAAVAATWNTQTGSPGSTALWTSEAAIHKLPRQMISVYHGNAQSHPLARGFMESTRPIRALTRGLDALTVLNSRDGATVSEVAQEIRLPRTTVYRILETLCNSGFVFRDAADDRYRLTVEVRRLRHGFDDDVWVSQIAKPHIDALCRDIVWPVSIATLSGSAMVVRESTDHDTPLAIERYSAGFRLPLLASAAGRVFLAHCPEAQREALLDILARSNKE